MTNRIQRIESDVLRKRVTAGGSRAARAFGSVVPRRSLSASTWTDVSVDATSLPKRFPQGITLALWQSDAELERRAADWAVAEDAIGPKGTKKLDATKLVFGRSLDGNSALDTILGDVASTLQAVVKASSAQPHTKVRVLALFTHGTDDWIGVGGGISSSGVPALVKKLAPHLANDVNLILFGCSAARGTKEEDAWVTTTLNDGGADSLCARFRDALLAEGLSLATVWGHTGVGHTTTNWTLREFRAADGKGANGRSFVKAYGIAWDSKVVDDLRDKMKAAKWTIDASNDAEFVKRAKEALQSWELRKAGPYGAWAKVNEKEKLAGRNLAEAAPTNPADVGAILAKEWTTHFEANWEAIAKVVGRKAKLAQAKAFASSFRGATGLSVEHPWSHSFPFAAGDAFVVETTTGAPRVLASGSVSACDDTRLGLTLALRDGLARSLIVDAAHVADGPRNRVRAIADGSAVLDSDVTMRSAGNVRELSPSNVSLLGAPIERATLARVDADTAALSILSGGVPHELRVSRRA